MASDTGVDLIGQTRNRLGPRVANMQNQANRINPMPQPQMDLASQGVSGLGMAPRQGGGRPLMGGDTEDALVKEAINRQFGRGGAADRRAMRDIYGGSGGGYGMPGSIVRAEPAMGRDEFTNWMNSPDRANDARLHGGGMRQPDPRPKMEAAPAGSLDQRPKMQGALKTGATDEEGQTGIDQLNQTSLAADDETFGMGDDTSPNLEWRKTLKYQTDAMPGFNTSGAGYDDKAANSVKNTFGRIASRYPPKPSSMKLIAEDPDFKRAFPGAYFDDKDRLHLPPEMLSDFESGVGGMGGAEGIDVLGGADVGSDTATGWSWQDSAHDGGGGAAAGGGLDGMFGGMGGYGGGNIDELTEGDTLKRIMAQIDQLAQGNNPYESAALLQLLQQGNADAMNPLV